MYKFILLLLLPLCVIPPQSNAQSATSWKAYELFSNNEIPVTTEGIQRLLPGYSIFKIQRNNRGASLHALIDEQENVNALIYQSPDHNNQMTRLVIPTPNSGAEMMRVYREDRSLKLSETQRNELLDLISNFSILTYQESDRPNKVIMVADTFDEPELDMMMVAKGVQAAKKEAYSEKHTIHPSCKIELSNRHIVHQEEIEEIKNTKGSVSLKICVKDSGEVYHVKFTQKGSTTLDEKLIKIAKNNAASLKFNLGNDASECGTITYFFNP